MFDIDVSPHTLTSELIVMTNERVFHNDEIHNNERTHGPRAKCGPFQKKWWPFLNPEEQKKVKSKMGKKHELALNKKGL